MRRYKIINSSIPLNVIKIQNSGTNNIFSFNPNTPKADILLNFRYGKWLSSLLKFANYDFGIGKCLANL